MRNERPTDLFEIENEIIPTNIDLRLGPNGQRSELLSGGIVNYNLKVYLAPESRPAVLSIYFTEGEERIDRELFTRSLIENTSLPIQKVIRYGIGNIRNNKDSYYLLKEYKEGKTLVETFQDILNDTSKEINIQSLLLNLGKNLNLISSIKLPKFGKIEGKGIISPTENCNWKEYYLYRLNRRINNLEKLDPEKQVGDYQLKTILSLIPKLSKYVKMHSEVLDSVTEPRFVHNDFHFLNIIAFENESEWKISGILDLESATAGDPEFDLISIESQLNLTPEFRKLFMANIEHFRLGYGNVVSNEYLQKRGLYHLTWSLSYFEAIMQMDTSIHPITEQIKLYMNRHYQVLKDISEGKNLKEVDIPRMF